MGLNHDQRLMVRVQRDDSEWALVECDCAMIKTFGDFFPEKIQLYWDSTSYPSQ